MLRSLVSSSARLLQRRSLVPVTSTGVRTLKISHREIYDADFETKVIAFFERPELDGWEARQGFNNLYALDLVPEPPIIIAGLKACRRLNDFGLAIRFLEATKMKCSTHEEVIWPYIMQEIGPTMKELGISTLEELGYHEPELALADPYRI
uniref:Cytochrome c oxidase subunit 5A, mitochondrial n=1 Tax=Lepeophtheirus salmonis TaxID=72036 RepID=C1BSN2_LEPSM|nr:Cytochrome c oxidase subunit 5A, mitochondrial precursor [Lepeophtheirus salmonis]